MDGGHKSVTVGLCDYESLRPHHEPETIRASDSYMDPKHSALNTKVERQGALVDQHMNVFHIETALNNRMYAGATAFLSKNEDEFTEVDRLKFEAMRWTLSKMPARREAQAVPVDPGAVPDDRLLRRQDRAGARGDPQALLGAVRASTCAARPTSSSAACRSSRPTT